MRDIMALVEELKEDMRADLKNRLASDEGMHKELLKKLLLQGLIKLMEAKIVIKCREQDVQLIEDIKDDAISEYRQKMVDEVEALKGKSPDEIPCDVVIDSKYLPSADDD